MVFIKNLTEDLNLVFTKSVEYGYYEEQEGLFKNNYCWSCFDIFFLQVSA